MKLKLKYDLFLQGVFSGETGRNEKNTHVDEATGLSQATIKAQKIAKAINGIYKKTDNPYYRRVFIVEVVSGKRIHTE